MNNSLQDCEQKMLKTIEALNSTLVTIRTGRNHLGILDHITIIQHGNPVSLKTIANIHVIVSRNLSITPFEKKNLLLEKTIRDSNLGLNPSTQGDSIRIPTLTEERRKEMVKQVKKEKDLITI